LYRTETDMGTKYGISLTVKIELRYSSGPTPNSKSFETPGELRGLLCVVCEFWSSKFEMQQFDSSFLI
jgi:hypothetical protein